MTPVSHALLPLLAAWRWLPRHGLRPATGATLVVAGFGVLPDLLDPHLTLAARQASWSHTLLATLGVTVVMGSVAGLAPRRLDPRVAAWACFAYLAHLSADAISGGVAMLAPFSLRIIGDTWLKPFWWIVCDGVLLGWVYVVYRWLPLRARLRPRQP